MCLFILKLTQKMMINESFAIENFAEILSKLAICLGEFLCYNKTP